MIKKAIAVMTSGGDSPGMNAAARAVVRTALYEGVDVYGINNGYAGMINDDIVKLTSRSVSDLIQRGGTFLGTARSAEFKTPEGRRKGYENLVKRHIEGLVIIGGDGSLTGGSLLSKETGLPIVGLPGTIDNDVWGMDYTIGCDTAANTIVEAINKLRDTASAHRRIMLVEVMGRNSGWLRGIQGLDQGADGKVPAVHQQGIRIIGDLPIYVAMDSADVWAEPQFFQLDDDLVPKAVAGVPPDYFTADGQLWGNPLYDWGAMRDDGFGWWIRRIDGAGKLYDVPTTGPCPTVSPPPKTAAGSPVPAWT